MGSFKGYLICTDMDRTLCIGSEVCKKNIDAIRRFQDGGGLFTVSTGRSFAYIRDTFSKIFTPNTYMITLNGTVISDCTDGKIIREFRLNSAVCAGLMKIADRYDSHINKRSVCADREIIEYGGVMPDVINKLVFNMESVDATAALRKDILAARDGSFSVNQSWDTGLEIIPSDSGKGVCVKYIKNLLGDDARITVAVGDYENDITMLCAADVSYAVEDASPEVIAASDRLTVPCMDGSIAKIVDDIDRGELA